MKEHNKSLQADNLRGVCIVVSLSLHFTTMQTPHKLRLSEALYPRTKMAYTLQALIGAKGTLSRKDLYGNIIALEQGFEILPFTTAFSKKNGFEILPLTGEDSKELPENIYAFCKAASFGCEIAYVEAEYFGGSGIQACMVFKNTRIEMPSVVESKAINLALRKLGVKACLLYTSDAADE